jgi:hypothetical protein
VLSRFPQLPVHNACAAVYAMVSRCSVVLHLWCVQVSGTSLSDQVSWDSITFGDALLAPTEIYVQRLLSLISKVDVKVSHHVCDASHCTSPGTSQQHCSRQDGIMLMLSIGIYDVNIRAFHLCRASCTSRAVASQRIFRALCPRARTLGSGYRSLPGAYLHCSNGSKRCCPSFRFPLNTVQLQSTAAACQFPRKALYVWHELLWGRQRQNVRNHDSQALVLLPHCLLQALHNAEAQYVQLNWSHAHRLAMWRSRRCFGHSTWASGCLW